jgi:hypothetical protein
MLQVSLWTVLGPVGQSIPLYLFISSTHLSMLWMRRLVLYFCSSLSLKKTSLVMAGLGT